MNKKYKEQDYNEMRQILRQKQTEGQQVLNKFKQIKTAQKKREQENKLAHHKVVWTQEHKKLQQQSIGLEKELLKLVEKFAETWNSKEDQIEWNWDELRRSEVAKQALRQQQTYDLESNVEEIQMMHYYMSKKSPPDKVAVKQFQEKLALLKENQLVQLKNLDEEESKVLDDLKELLGCITSIDTPRFMVSDEPIEQRTISKSRLSRYHEELLAENVPFADPQIKTQLLQQLFSLDTTYEIQMQQLKEEIQLSAEKNHGWDDSSHFHFVKIYKEYKRYHTNVNGNTFKCGSDIIERLAIEMPHKTRQELEVHASWYEQHIRLVSKRKSLKKMWRMQRKDFIITAKDILLEAAQFAFEKLQKELADIEEGEEKEKKRTLYTAWREEKFKQLLDEQDKEREKFEKQMEEQSMRERELEEEKQRKRLLVQQYQDQRKLNLLREEEMNFQRRMEEEQINKLRAQQNQDRVVFRAMQTEKQMKEKKMKIEKERLLEEEKEKRLEKLIETVRPDVPSDPNRIRMPTEASKVSNKVDDNARLFPLQHGYTDHDITADRRFKIREALLKAGLQDTAYGRFVMSTTTGNKAPRTDNLTFEQREAATLTRTFVM